MTNLPATQTETAPAIAEPQQTNVLDRLTQQAQSWAVAAQIAEQMARTDFAGQFKGKPADLAAAILKGAEVGIPAASIGKSIYVVHGTPSLYGKAALSIALQNGYIVETLEDTPQAVTVRMTAPHGQQMDVRYTIKRATQEGLVKDNKVQYETRPSKMLYWKCIGELADRMIPHLTNGMPIKEDWEQSPVKMTATRQDIKVKAQAPVPAINAPAPRDDLSNLISAVQQIDSAEELQEFMSITRKLTEEEDEELREAARSRWHEIEGEGAQ